MCYVAACLQAVLGGNKASNAGDIEKIPSSVGTEAERDQLDKVISQLNGKRHETACGARKIETLLNASWWIVAVAAPAGGGALATAKKEE